MILPRVTRRITIGLLLAGLAVPASAALRRRRLYGVDWQAVSLSGQPFASARLPTLRIERDGRYGGSSGCNRYGGKAVIKGAKITPGNAFSTRMACIGPSGENEARYLPALGKATAWRFQGDDLVLETAQGPLLFQRK